MTIGIVDVGIGNIGSLRGALHRYGWDTVTITSPADISRVSHIILPGVGSFSNAMMRLLAANLVNPIKNCVLEGKPILGICLGMQLLADLGFEGGESKGLGLIAGSVVKFEKSTNLPSTHVGWNELCPMKSHHLLNGIKRGVDFYFVHSYFFKAVREQDVIGTTDYGFPFASFIARDNVVGVQFHPEKSQINGLRLIENFCLWDGVC